ncbi:MAG: molybdopterin-dependent oxidoreductase [Oscillospiraceae bacterium]|nr:molybdopterin-dependent oxidoreductase [Oscillospiraceae bacterium]
MIIPTMGMNNCGGRCLLYAHVEKGRVEKLTTDTSAGNPKCPPLTACARGLNYHKTYLDEAKRLLHPLIRVGERGEGRFRQASWEEALDLITRQWIRIRDAYGPESRYVHYGWGVSGVITPIDLAKHLLALDGGYLGYYNSYSNACIAYTTSYLYGTSLCGNSFEDLLHSSLIILWGHNPAEIRFDSLMFYLRLAQKQGIPIVCVDPRYSDTARQLKAEWLPIRPTSDSAVMDAMAYVMLEEELYDRQFIESYCQGFTHETMPEGYEGEEDYFSYLQGLRDGLAKTPEWAAAISGLPADAIRSLARRYAMAPAAALLPGYGPQRNGNGEQTTRGAIMLACLTGNVGKAGGSSGSGSWRPMPPMPHFEKAANPYPGKIPVYAWTKALEQGMGMGAEAGVIGVDALSADIKMIVNLGGNALINQHGDINRTAALLKDESRCEFILCSDVFLTPSARFADVVLPAVSFLETNNMVTPWVAGEFFGAVNKVVEPLGECRHEYDWLKEIARRLGLEQAFTQGHETVEDWLETCYEKLKRQVPELPAYEDFKRAGVYRYENTLCHVAFAKEIADPAHYPFPTPSGKIEIFSPTLFERGKPDVIPGIPRYVPSDEGVEPGPYPLQLVGYHTKRRCHSIHDNNPDMEALDPQRVHLHPADAEARGIHDGDLVLVFNQRGTMRLSAKVTEGVMPGVAAIAQGAWYTPDEKGIDSRGNINVLASQALTPLAFGNAQHTIRGDIRLA